MTSPLSHKYENYSEPGWLRGDLHSKNNVSKYKQPLILFCKLINNCSQFLRIMLFFPSHFSNDIYESLNVISGDEFFLQKSLGSRDTMVTY